MAARKKTAKKVAKKVATKATKATAKKATAKKATKPTAAKKMSGVPRADYGTAPDAYFALQSPEQRVLLEQLRALIAKAVPDATSTIKWGVPFYERNGKPVCAIAAFKNAVGINFFAPVATLVDPAKVLEGTSKNARMLKVRSAADINSANILGWLKAAAA